MTDLTTGQRIAQCRRLLNLSQESLGEKVGVSRQAISKWEADAALPDIDKLITLSKLFGVNVGWLLGVEEMPEPQPESPAISEELLLKIEEVVKRYQPQKKPLPLWKKLLLGAAALALLWGGLGLAREWQYTRHQVSYLTSQITSAQQHYANIAGTLATLEERIENINTTVEEASASLASYEFSVSPNIEDDYARVELTAIPKNWNESWIATFCVRHQGALSETQQCHWDGTALNGALKLNFVDGLEYYLVIGYPDGTQESIPLEDKDAQNLQTSYTITCKLYPVIIQFNRMSMHSESYELSFDTRDLYLRRPNPEENPQDWLWTRADYVLCQRTDGVRIELQAQPILNLEEDAKVWEYEGRFYPGFGIAYPQDGDVFELWVMLELANGISLEKCVGSWYFIGNDFSFIE